MSLFLQKERQVLNQYFSGFDYQLKQDSLLSREMENVTTYMDMAKSLGITSLMIPKEYGGKGASALEAIYIQRSIGSRSPSLAVSFMMHQFSIASLIEAAKYQTNLQSALTNISEHNLLLASAFAEGVESNIFTPNVVAENAVGGIIVNGSKKPCTNSRTMDLLTASVQLPNGELAVITIPADTEGVEVKDFWSHWILKGTHTEEVILKNVFVSDDLIYRAGGQEDIDPIIMNGLVWFELFMIATYIGVTSALVEKVIESERLPMDKVFELVSEVEGAMSSLEGLAFKFERNQFSELMLQESLFVRGHIDKVLEKISTQASKLLGGMNYLSSKETSYLLLTSQLISFHPPSKQDTFELFEQYAKGVEHEYSS
ncbi:alkylation response protein AidB-like acyl-CoA dehydrogenase [Salibacterium salarium]|uniref:acyl-CoA dehydrogenase family protein n=1 Tax=Salibacterium salarium TaxID=284579 RepID=UPI00278133AA|nr:acyl-CoA dehydrogenase family protein [Salibacterium salarium]MDQ0300595.1 alkylation response protein AidB-like acyl-CoA dehydrogenase [Salibacterium salarium]